MCSKEIWSSTKMNVEVYFALHSASINCFIVCSVQSSLRKKSTWQVSSLTPLRVGKLPVGMLLEGWVYGQEELGSSTVRCFPNSAGFLLFMAPAISIIFSKLISHLPLNLVRGVEEEVLLKVVGSSPGGFFWKWGSSEHGVLPGVSFEDGDILKMASSEDGGILKMGIFWRWGYSEDEVFWRWGVLLKMIV